MIVRKNCTICEHSIFRPVDTFKDMPIHIGATDTPHRDYVCDQIWVQCMKCGCIQLQSLIDQNILYSIYHAPGTVGIVWKRHHEEFSAYVSHFGGRNILEIGAGTWTLSNEILNHTPWESYIAVDPLLGDQINGKALHRKELFTENFDLLGKTIDTIVISHTMEHFYDVSKMVKKIETILPPNGKLIISIPVHDRALNKGYHNAIGFEHTYMVTFDLIKYVLESNGFSVDDVSAYNDVNVFISATKKNILCRIPSTQLDDNYSIFNKYLTQTDDRAEYLWNIFTTTPFKPTFIFGGHVFSQVPLTLNPLLLPYITAVLDGDPTKQNKRLYGFRGLAILSAEILSTIPNPRVIVDCAQYTDSIIELLRNINPAVEVI